jgi:U3 small nucleolar RNA-associated protein 14
MNARGVDLDVDQQRELNAQLERDEQLRRKIQGLTEDDGAPENFLGNDGENGVDVAGVAARAFDELTELGGTDQQVRQTAKTKNGLLEMKFMRDAEERGYRVTDRMADDFRAELVGMMADGADIVESEGDGPLLWRPCKATKAD